MFLVFFLIWGIPETGGKIQVDINDNIKFFRGGIGHNIENTLINKGTEN
jgi:hypothetical protein